MSGLTIIAIGIVYFAIVVGITRLAYLFAKKRGYGRGRQSLFSVCGFLFSTFPLFWDVIPTYSSYRNYCETEAGIKILKTPEQWKNENQDVVPELVSTKNASIVSVGKNVTRQAINNRLAVETFHGFVFLAVRKFEQKLIDTKSAENLVVSTSFYAAYVTNDLTPYESVEGLQPLKFWIRKPACKPTSSDFEQVVEKFKNIGRM